MNWWGSGFVPIIIYAAASSAAIDFTSIVTESNLDILTEDGKEILVESA